MKGVKKYFLVEDYGGAIDTIKQNSFQNIFISKKNSNLKNNVNEIKKMIYENEIDLVVVDIYKISKKFVSLIKKFVKVVVITDLKSIDYSADLLVNGFIGFNNKIESNRFNTKCLLGPKFQIITKVNRKNSKISKSFKLLATFGGYDVKGISNSLLNQIKKNNIKFKTKIILGPSTKNSKIKTNSLKNVTVVKSTKNMLNEISKSEIGICSGGITSYEFALSKIPFAIICQQKHQLLTAREWEKRGVCINLGMADKNIDKKLEKFLRLVENEKSNFKKIKKVMIDGKGSQRVAAEILKTVKK
jgi:spore coat polysaccharide biosynthesis predicted glycosyltransferase SpsG